MADTGELRDRFARFGLRALRIGASTVAIIELLRSDWIGGVSASLAWLLFVQVERRWSLAQKPGGGAAGDQIQSQVEGPKR